MDLDDEQPIPLSNASSFASSLVSFLIARERSTEVDIPFDPNSFLKKEYRHKRITTINHWQLRDLLQAKSSTEFYYVFKKLVIRYCTTDRKIQRELDLGFEPTCMNAAHGYMAAGGKGSELVVKDLDTQSIKFQSSIGGKINNSIQISKHNNDIYLHISNNDKTVKLFHLGPTELEPVMSIKFSVPMNYASVSPDSRFMVAVGDSKDVYLYGVSNGTSYNRIRVLSEAQDGAFCCSWRGSSNQFAVASQDGLVCVWDVRSSNLFARLKTKATASRCVKFSTAASPVDLMIFSEHTSYLHVVDARTFDKEETVCVSQDEDISGISFSPDNSKVFAGLVGGVTEYDVDGESRNGFPEGCLLK